MSCPASAGPGVFTRHTDCTCSRHTEALRHRGRVSSCHRAPLYETRRRGALSFSWCLLGTVSSERDDALRIERRCASIGPKQNRRECIGLPGWSEAEAEVLGSSRFCEATLGPSLPSRRNAHVRTSNTECTCLQTHPPSPRLRRGRLRHPTEVWLLLDNDRHVRSAEALRRGAFSLSSQRRMRRVCGYGAACNRNRSRSAPASTNITITGTIAGRAAMPMPTRGTNAAIPVQTTSMTTAKLTS